MCSRPGPRSSRRMNDSPSTISVVVAAVRPSAIEPPKTVSTRKNESSEPAPIASPAGTANAASARSSRPRYSGPSLGARASTNDGIPIVRNAATVRWRGRNGNAKPKIARREDQEAGVDGLRQVEPRQPVDVARDPPSLADGPRQHRELVLEQHDVGDALADLAARAHRDGEPGALERRHVVDAVADHRRRAAALGQSACTSAFFCSGRMRQKIVLRSAASPSAEPSCGRSGPSMTPASRGHADRLRHRRHRLARVAGDQLQVDVLLAHEVERLGGIRPQPLLEHDERPRLDARRRLRGRVARAAPPMPRRRRPRGAPPRCAPRACAEGAAEARARRAARGRRARPARSCDSSPRRASARSTSSRTRTGPRR